MFTGTVYMKILSYESLLHVNIKNAVVTVKSNKCKLLQAFRKNSFFVNAWKHFLSAKRFLKKSLKLHLKAKRGRQRHRIYGS